MPLRVLDDERCRHERRYRRHSTVRRRERRPRRQREPRRARGRARRIRRRSPRTPIRCSSSPPVTAALTDGRQQRLRAAVPVRRYRAATSCASARRDATRTCARPSRTTVPSRSTFRPGHEHRLDDCSARSSHTGTRSAMALDGHAARGRGCGARASGASRTLSGAADVKADPAGLRRRRQCSLRTVAIRRSPQCECRRGARPSWHVAAGRLTATGSRMRRTPARRRTASTSADGCPDARRTTRVADSARQLPVRPSTRRTAEQRRTGRRLRRVRADHDNDGRRQACLDDTCPTVYGTSANGCPAPPPPPTSACRATWTATAGSTRSMRAPPNTRSRTMAARSRRSPRCRPE